MADKPQPDPAKVREAYRRAQAELEVCQQVAGALQEVADEKRREQYGIEQRVQAISRILESLPQEAGDPR